MSNQEKRDAAAAFNAARDERIAGQIKAEDLRQFILERFDAGMQIGIQQGDGYQIMYGPFPSFILHLKGDQLTLSIDVTADAPSMTALAMDLVRQHPTLIYGGCFVFNPNNMQQIVVDPVQCYEMKLVHMKRLLVSHLATQAAQAATQEAQEPKIILPDTKIITNPSGV